MITTKGIVMRELPQVTLIGVDCVDVGRLLHVTAICQRAIRFGAVRILTTGTSRIRTITLSQLAAPKREPTKWKPK